ncbi:hypothetical protein GCM10007972_24330 [Iodidimonas muriae]|uniref:Uncharacterized protein n=1 Tax=Iodidimonas muriae TaxID=261467 RepID=A0ABQ2LHQ6_9PROT|nr:hypothetical protein [Iodidimonas muriae]GER08613.1 hypothetical protein JCM17843_29230 [Kordiimonadales bacterium JCM 17843]GGO15818.1 hypothetical protein GCM10007972_24330 [Iodidimonas muriae]
MKKYLALLVMAVFVAIQFADIAILDAAPTNGLELHSQSDHDQDKQAFDGCEIHCGCHALHHMAPAGNASECLYEGLTKPILSGAYIGKNSLGQGPPVPPPNA